MKFFLLAIFHFVLLATSVLSQTIVWEKCLGGTKAEGFPCVIETHDHKLIVTGYTSSNDGDVQGNHGGTCTSDSCFDAWVIKLDESGNILWQHPIGGSSEDFLTSIIQNSDQGILLGGYSGSIISGDKTENSLNSRDYWIVMLDTLGNIVWQKTIGGISDDYLTSLMQTSDGGFLLGGESSSNISGDKTENSLGQSDYWIVKLATDNSLNIQTPENQIFSTFTLYPNPTGEVLYIDYAPNQNITSHNYYILNVEGKLIQQGILQLGKNQLNIEDLPNGHYLIKSSGSTQGFEVLK